MFMKINEITEGWKGALAGGLAGGAVGGIPGALIGGAIGAAAGPLGRRQERDIQNAYKLGQLAAREGKTQEDNPYEEGWFSTDMADEVDAWNDGWEHATKANQLTPKHGPYKHMELFPITKKPWTQEQIDWYEHKVRLMTHLGWSDRQMAKWFKKRYL